MSGRSPRSTAYVVAAILAALFGAVLFAHLRDASLVVQQTGMHGILAADALSEGRGFEVAEGKPFKSFGPLYPMLLSIPARSDVDVIASVYFVNCAALALTLFLLYALCREMQLRWPWAAPALYAMLAVPYYLIRQARPASVAICMVVATLLALTCYGRRRNVGWLLVAAGCCSLALVSRYLQIFTLLPLATLAVARLAGPGLRRRIRDVAVFAAIALPPIGIWVARNVRITGYLTGRSRFEQRANALDTTPLENVWTVLRTAFLDLFGFDAVGVRSLVHGEAPWPHLTASAVACLAGSVALVVSVVLVRRGAVTPSGGGLGPDARRGLALAAGFVAAHAIALIVLWSIGNNDPIQTRYVAPIYVPLVALLLGAVSAAASSGAGSRPHALIAVVALSVAIPNVPKALRILGDEPHPHVLDIRTRKDESRFYRDLDWSLEQVSRRPAGAPGQRR